MSRLRPRGRKRSRVGSFLRSAHRCIGAPSNRTGWRQMQFLCFFALGLSIDGRKCHAIPYGRVGASIAAQEFTPELESYPTLRRFMSNELRNFLSLSYDELEQLNLKAKEQRQKRVSADKIQEERIKYLTDEKRIKAVTVLFSDLEGRLHMLDYDKKFLVKNYDNLTFDGSSIRGFTAQRESDLRLTIDWSAFYWAPADFFGPGKVLVFSEVTDKGGTPYNADIRGILKLFADRMHKDQGYTLNAANEIEGFIFNGIDAEQRYHETGQFDYVNTGGYYHSLPGDPLRA